MSVCVSMYRLSVQDDKNEAKQKKFIPEEFGVSRGDALIRSSTLYLVCQIKAASRPVGTLLHRSNSDGVLQRHATDKKDSINNQ